MLKKEYRLCNNNDFIKIYKKGKRHSNSGVLLLCVKNDIKTTRIGVVINKKFSTSSVKRNAQKRIFRRILQNYYSHIISGVDVVLSYTNHSNMLPYKEASSLIYTLLNKNQLFKK